MPKHVWQWVIATVLVLATADQAAEPFDPVAAGELPRYVFLHRMPEAGWNQGRPETFTPAALREMVEKVGARGNSRLRIGAAFSFSILEDDLDLMLRSLDAALTAATEADVPLFMCLDGQNWWRNRPDLWNWWDPNLPGFNPANRMNVEWTDWGPGNAIKISWRNWGHQVRIRPAQNTFAPRVQAEVREKLGAGAAVIAKWYRSLPKDRKYLFGGIKVGWEASINVNAYHYRDGNRIFEQNPTDASKDPDKLDLTEGFTFGHAGLGYAAATVLGIEGSQAPSSGPAGS
ncbi:MAG: hypothetical protein HY718_13255, partial [Planctomycetes bacterium]|nr:hypothetical protein [Planctomycetota bacterium]